MPVSPRFNRDAESLTLPGGLGIPDWVFYGVVLPWLACIVLTFIFALLIFQEDDLDETHQDRLAGESAS